MGWNKDKTIFTLDGPETWAGEENQIFKMPKEEEITKKLRKLRQPIKEGKK